MSVPLQMERFRVELSRYKRNVNALALAHRASPPNDDALFQSLGALQGAIAAEMTAHEVVVKAAARCCREPVEVESTLPDDLHASMVAAWELRPDDSEDCA